MSNPETLKERIRAGETITTVCLPMSSGREQVQEVIRRGAGAPLDLLYIDAQHGPVSDWDVMRICSAAEERGVPVQMCIRHLREVYLIGHYLRTCPLAWRTVRTRGSRRWRTAERTCRRNWQVVPFAFYKSGERYP